MLTRRNIIIALIVLVYVQLPEKLRNDIWELIFGSISAALAGAGSNAAPVATTYATRTIGGPESDVTIGGLVFICILSAIFWYASRGLTIQTSGGGAAASSRESRPVSSGPAQPSREGRPSYTPGSTSKMKGSFVIPLVILAIGVLLTTTPQGKEIASNLNFNQVSNLFNQIKGMLP